MKYLVKCTQCGKELKRYYKYDNYFCSRKCQGVYRKKHCNTKIIIQCVVCNKEIRLKKSQYEKSNKNGRITCSRKCMGKLRKKIYIGKDNPNCKYKTFPIDFFKKIDTEQKAYILGFIASDGSPVSTNNSYLYRKPIVIKRNIAGSDNTILKYKVFYKNKKSEEGMVEFSIIKQGNNLVFYNS